MASHGTCLLGRLIETGLPLAALFVSGLAGGACSANRTSAADSSLPDARDSRPGQDLGRHAETRDSSDASDRERSAPDAPLPSDLADVARGLDSTTSDGLESSASDGQDSSASDGLESSTSDTADSSTSDELDGGGEVLPPGAFSLDKYGGLADLPVMDATGYFTTGILGDRVWVVDPEGNAFASLGVSHIGFGSDYAPDLGYSPGTLNEMTMLPNPGMTPDEYAAAVIEHKLDAVSQLGFNSMASWSNGSWPQATGKMAYAWNLAFSSGATQQSVPIPTVNSSGFPDVFHPQFKDMCLEYAQKSIPVEIRTDPWNLGYYSDNELKWWGQSFLVQSPGYTLADDFIAQPASSPGKQAFVSYMQERYQGDIAALNAVYAATFASWEELAAAATLSYEPQDQVQFDDREGFVGRIADAYFSAADAALDKTDPNHLNLCARLASSAPGAVVWEMGQHCDVVSINDYYLKDDPMLSLLLGGPAKQRWAKWADLVFDAAGGPKPFLLTEWGVRAHDSGLPNTYGAGYTVDTQLDRTQNYEFVLHWLLDREQSGFHYLSGIHWFEHTDEPPTGRFDGEDCNYGIASVRQESYQALVDAMKGLHVAVQSALVHGSWPLTLPPPADVAASPSGSGLLVEWTAVPGAADYVVTVMTHQAGLTGHSCCPVAVDGTSTQVEMLDRPSGWYWAGVTARHPDLPSSGMRVSNAVQLTPTSQECQEQPVNVDCRLCRFVMDNFPVEYPAAGAGAAYVSDVDCLLPSDPKVLLAFEPSSLGLLGLVDPDSQMKIGLDIGLLQGSPGQYLEVDLAPHATATPSGALVPATEFMTLSVETGTGDVVAQWNLGDLDLPVEVNTVVNLPIEQEFSGARVEFAVDLFQPDLPMESCLRAWAGVPHVVDAP